MVDRHCRGRLDLFPSTKINNMFKKYSIYNNDIVPFLHVLNRTISQIYHRSITQSQQRWLDIKPTLFHCYWDNSNPVASIFLKHVRRTNENRQYNSCESSISTTDITDSTERRTCTTSTRNISQKI